MVVQTRRLEQLVRLADELHVGVLNAVVDHLDKMAGAVGANVGAARLVTNVCRDVFEDGPESIVGFPGPARHDGRTL